MKSFNILQGLLFLTLGYLVFSGSSCFNTSDNPEQDDKCGPDDFVELEFAPLGYRSTYLDGTMREFNYNDPTKFQSICSEEHVNVSYLVTLESGFVKPDDISFSGNASWSFFGRSTPLLHTVYEIYRGNDNIGLKQAFPDKPGNLDLLIKVRFPTRGSEYVDAAYVDSLVSKLNLSATYKLPKP